jgi:hypothetical protein
MFFEKLKILVFQFERFKKFGRKLIVFIITLYFDKIETNEQKIENWK